MTTTRTALQIGDRNDANDLIIADTGAPDIDGACRVTVRELVGIARNEPLPIGRMRSFARRALDDPGAFRSSRLLHSDHNGGHGAIATFAFSPLERAK